MGSGLKHTLSDAYDTDMKRRLVLCGIVLATLNLGSSCFAQVPPLPEPLKGALQYYLSVDCHVGEKRDLLGRLVKLRAEQDAKIQRDVDAYLNLLFANGPDTGVLGAFDKSLKNQWAKRQAFLKRNPRLGLSAENLKLVRGLSQGEFAKQRRADLVTKYRRRAVAAILTIGSTDGLKALERASHGGDKQIKTIIEEARRQHKLRSSGSVAIP